METLEFCSKSESYGKLDTRPCRYSGVCVQDTMITANVYITNIWDEVSPSNWGRFEGWWEMELRTWRTAELRPGRSKHRLLNRRENMKNMRMFHLTERCKLSLQVKYIYKTFLQGVDFPQEGALQVPLVC